MAHSALQLHQPGHPGSDCIATDDCINGGNTQRAAADICDRPTQELSSILRVSALK